MYGITKDISLICSLEKKQKSHFSGRFSTFCRKNTEKRSFQFLFSFFSLISSFFALLLDLWECAQVGEEAGICRRFPVENLSWKLLKIRGQQGKKERNATNEGIEFVYSFPLFFILVSLKKYVRDSNKELAS